MSHKLKRILVFVLTVLIMYNVAALCLAGVTGHTASFWVSYVFAMISFMTVISTLIALEDEKMQMRDWLFRLPLIKHGAIYVAAATAVSVIFMLLEKSVRFVLPLVIHVLLLGGYVLFALSCITAKEMVQQVNADIKRATDFMKLLTVEANAAARSTKDATVTMALQKLAEKIRYSDRVSYPELEQMEQELLSCVQQIRSAAVSGETDNILAMCEKTENLLAERNDRCRLLK